MSKPVIRVALEVDVHVHEAEDDQYLEEGEQYLEVEKVRTGRIQMIGPAKYLLALGESEPELDYSGKMDHAVQEAIREHTKNVWRGQP